LRREAVLRGWQFLVLSAALLAAAGLAFGFGAPLIRLAVPPTALPTATLSGG
jgi:hypothetical protein